METIPIQKKDYLLSADLINCRITLQRIRFGLLYTKVGETWTGVIESSFGRSPKFEIDATRIAEGLWEGLGC